MSAPDPVRSGLRHALVHASMGLLLLGLGCAIGFLEIGQDAVQHRFRAQLGHRAVGEAVEPQRQNRYFLDIRCRAPILRHSHGHALGAR